MVPADSYPVLVLPLVLLLLERSRTQLLLYYLVCVVAVGLDGVAVASVYWVVFSLAKLVLDFLGVTGLQDVGGDSV